MNWPKALAKHGISLDINWQELWSSIGTPLTDPTEENAWWRLIQRAWNAKNRHPTEPDKSCRLNCGCNDESMLHMITCSRAKPLWRACLKICTTLFNERGGLNIVSAIVFNQDNGKMLGPLTRAFLRHATQQYYQDVTNVAKHKRAFFWETTLHAALIRLRSAALRKGYEIRKHFVLRKHTHLVGVVAEEERKKFAPLIMIDQQGHSALAPAFARIIEDAESSATHRLRHVSAARGTARPKKRPRSA